MANTGLFRFVFIFIFGLVLSRALAAQDPLSSRSWIRAQMVKRSDETVELSHTLDDDDDNNSGQPNILTGGDGSHRAKPRMSGGIILSGPANRLSNFHQVTSSWKIVGCTNKHKRKQAVLAYCVGTNPEKDCADIFLGGAKNTIVKLPSGCGASPFGHVVKFAPTQRKLPPAEIKELAKKDYTVYQLVFDYDFASIPYKKGDPAIKFEMDFSNIPKPKNLTNKSTTPLGHKNWFSRLDQVYQKDTTIPISHDFSANVATLSQQCTGFSMSLDMNAKGNLNGSLSYGYYIIGTIRPDVINSHYVYLKANAFVTTNVDMTGSIKYTFTALSVPILPTVGMPGLDYPGLLTVGPYFQINAVLSGELAVAGTVNVNSGFSIPPVDISFGNSTDPVSHAEATNFADVTLSKDIKVAAGLTFALTPQIGLGIKVFGGIVDADVSLQPSAGITAGGSANLNTETGEASKPCLELSSNLNLNWGVGGKLGPWGAGVSGRIWGIKKTLWQKCFTKARKRAIMAESRWQKVDGNFTSPLPPKHYLPNQFGEIIICPSVNPFIGGDSP